jgi:hypothetical protein
VSNLYGPEISTAVKSRIVGSRNLAIGREAGYSLTTASDCVLIGIEAGADVTTEDGIVIIGDGIRKVAEGETVAYGDTILGQPVDPEGLAAGDPHAWGEVLHIAVRATAESMRKLADEHATPNASVASSDSVALNTAQE